MDSIGSPRRRNHHSKSGESTGGNSGSRSNQSKYIRECVCGRGLACVGMTQAFRLLGDPRSYYVELPRFRPDPPAYKYTFRNNLRAAYLRHLKRLNPNMDLAEVEKSPQRRYVALHHFHPAVVKAFYENPLTSGAAHKHKVPISITEHELQELSMDIFPEDRILSVTGVPTGGYYFCPSYPQEHSHDDLKDLIKEERADREASEKKNVAENHILLSKHNGAVDNIEENKSGIAGDQSCAVLADRNKEAPIEDVEKISSDPLVSQEKECLSDRQEEGGRQLNAGDDSSADEGEKTGDGVDVHGEDFDVLISNTTSAEFDNLWAEEASLDVLGNIREPQHSSENREMDEFNREDADELLALPVDSEESEPPTQSPGSTDVRSTGREADHPWETPKYRRHLERADDAKRKTTAPAQFIDPTIITQAQRQNLLKNNDTKDSEDTVSMGFQDSSETKERISRREKRFSGESASVAQKSAAAISAAALSAMQSIDEIDETGKELSTTYEEPSATASNNESRHSSVRNTAKQLAGAGNSKASRNLSDYNSIDDLKSRASEDGVGAVAIASRHSLPGSDPTLRIQVHNDLIAWESKRRSDISDLLELNRAKWQAVRDLLRDGVEEVEFAERLVLGFAKAGVLFADSIQAVYDDRLLDDAGNTVNNSYLQNRLQMKRSAQEYSIENQDSSVESGQSSLLNSILQAQLKIAEEFRNGSAHIEDEILPELQELLAGIKASARQIELLGDSIVAELKRSEIEVKNIWDVFDAMVTGDLMEYSVHGSMHGSQHGGSLHSSFGQSTGSLHGFLNSRGDSEGPMMGSVHSPLVKSTFRQVGALEDGWLVETYYRCSVAYQRAVFGIAKKELANLTQVMTDLEEGRFQKLHQVMLAFVPRQRRVFKALPEHFKEVLNNLVGLRIDEDSLQTLIDASIRDRSHDHLKRGASHRSSIMNRSRVNKVKEDTNIVVEEIESSFGDPFKSSMVLLSRVVELQPGGLRGIVNATWKSALVVVTAEGNLHVFILPDDKTNIGLSPSEAFKCLYPVMTFDSVSSWTRKSEIAKRLTPTLTFDLKQSTLSIPKMQIRHLQVVEEKPLQDVGVTRNRFMKAVKAAADSQLSKRCTLRLPSSAATKEWINLLERTKKVLRSKT